MIVPVIYSQSRFGYSEDLPLSKDTCYENPIHRWHRCELQTEHGPYPALPPHLYVTPYDVAYSFPRAGSHPDLYVETRYDAPETNADPRKGRGWITPNPKTD